MNWRLFAALPLDINRQSYQPNQPIFIECADGQVFLRRKISTTPERSRIMSAIRSHGNKSTEGRFVDILRQNKLVGWRRNWPLFGKPDFVFPKVGAAVFLDGCFWHGCSKCCPPPATNKSYWKEKLDRNRARDHKVTKVLRQQGWIVIRIWEHDLKYPGKAIFRLQAAGIHAKK